LPYKLRFVPSVTALLKDMANGDPNDRAKLKKVNRALGRLEKNPRHPGLNSYEYHNFAGAPSGVKVWHSYVENHTSSAWRIFWHYGPNEGATPVISVLHIGPHA
jgi:hypothetical protein